MYGYIGNEKVAVFINYFWVFVSTSYADDNQFFDSKVDYFAQPKKDCQTVRPSKK